ncbi:MAG: hypothetical protein OXN86_02445 [Chloroflexota bacterium]|nr:hypothetical protein [Rhodospirillales bacterium]MDE0380787.1 hypothetical protein [Rhodospirillales bacterium]MDE2891355.1 hypothetical protein [Chloroflexota bacterium]
MAMEPIIGRQDGVLWIRVSCRFAGGDAMKFVETTAATIDKLDRAVVLGRGRMP